MSTATGRVLLDAEQLGRTLARIGYEIVEKQPALDQLCLVGIYTRGVPLAHRLRRRIAETTGVDVPVGALDIAFYRDDVAVRGAESPAHAQPVAQRHEAGLPDRGPHGRAGRRRPLHGPHDPRGDRRDLRLRPAGAGAARRAGRPRPPRAADPRGLRGQEPADGAHRAGDGAAAGDGRGGRGRAGQRRERGGRRNEQAPPDRRRRPAARRTSSASSTPPAASRACWRAR